MCRKQTRRRRSPRRRNQRSRPGDLPNRYSAPQPQAPDRPERPGGSMGAPTLRPNPKPGGRRKPAGKPDEPLEDRMAEAADTSLAHLRKTRCCSCRRQRNHRWKRRRRHPSLSRWNDPSSRPPSSLFLGCPPSFHLARLRRERSARGAQVLRRRGACVGWMVRQTSACDRRSGTTRTQVDCSWLLSQPRWPLIPFGERGAVVRHHKMVRSRALFVSSERRIVCGY